MKIEYVGNNVYGEFAFETAALAAGFDFSATAFTEGEPLSNMTDDLIITNADVYIIDISSFSEEEKELAEQFTKLRDATNAQIIIHAPLYNRESKILLDMRALGFNNIITALENQGIMRQELIEAVSMAKENKDDEEHQEALIQEREDIIHELEADLPGLAVIRRQEEEKEEPDKQMKIAVIGSREFIGTTTVALQLVKYLNQKNEASAAYIELNKSRYIKNIREYYEAPHNDNRLSSITMRGVTMFEDARKMPEILSEGFSYYVYDYGSISLVNDISSIYEKDIIILVGGIKPNELAQTTEAMGELYEQRNQFYILNHVPSKSRQEALTLMADRKSNAFFLEECVDPFVYNPDNGKVFDAILNSDYKPETNMKRKKIRRIFK